jgi:hypothetical protein
MNRPLSHLQRIITTHVWRTHSALTMDECIFVVSSDWIILGLHTWKRYVKNDHRRLHTANFETRPNDAMVVDNSYLSIPNIIANVCHAWLYECAVRAMRKRLKFSSYGDDSGSKKRKRDCGGAYGEFWRSLHLAGVWCQEVDFVLVRLSEIWLHLPWRCFYI